MVRLWRRIQLNALKNSTCANDSVFLDQDLTIDHDSIDHDFVAMTQKPDHDLVHVFDIILFIFAHVVDNHVVVLFHTHIFVCIHVVVNHVFDTNVPVP